jgi:uncharacterized protein YegP (UPF0339 family)
MSAMFELLKDGPGAYRFQLTSSTGEILVVSNAFTSREAAEEAIQTVRTAAPHAFLKDQVEPTG